MATEARDPRKGEVKLKNVRLSFSHIFRAQASKDGGSPKFNCAFLMDKNTTDGKANAKLISDMMRKMVTDKYGAGKEPTYKPEKKCLRDGSLEQWDGYADHYYVTASNSKRPTILDRDKTPLLEEDGKPYSGSYVNAIIRIWIQDHKDYGKRINASLEGIQFLRDGEAFGAAPLDEDAFDDMGSDGEDDASEKPAESEDDLL